MVGVSADTNGNRRPFLWQNGVMTDLNTLIPADSPFYLLSAEFAINDWGQIPVLASQTTLNEVHACLLTPTTQHWANHGRPKVDLPENVRDQLHQQRRSDARPGRKLMRPQ